MSRRFLTILSCNYGGGHKRAGEAIAAEWEALTGGRAEMVDYFARFVHPVFDAVTKFSYIQSVRRAPMMYGMFYKLTGDIRPDSLVQRAINRMGMERSATVSGSLPIPAMALGQKVSKSRRTKFFPTCSHLDAFPPRRCPLFKTPRSASPNSRLPLNVASDSSNNSVGCVSWIVLYNTALETLLVSHGPATSISSNSSRRDLPHRFSADVIAR